jgi:hypothetical protein
MAEDLRSALVNYKHPINECREIVYEAAYDVAMKAIGGGDFFLADEFLEGIEWLVQRSPESGRPIEEGSAVHYFCGSSTPGLPAATIYYTFNDRKVWFLDIHLGDTDGR